MGSNNEERMRQRIISSTKYVGINNSNASKILVVAVAAAIYQPGVAGG